MCLCMCATAVEYDWLVVFLGTQMGERVMCVGCMCVYVCVMVVVNDWHVVSMGSQVESLCVYLCVYVCVRERLNCMAPTDSFQYSQHALPCTCPHMRRHTRKRNPPPPHTHTHTTHTHTHTHSPVQTNDRGIPGVKELAVPFNTFEDAQRVRFSVAWYGNTPRGVEQGHPFVRLAGQSHTSARAHTCPRRWK